MGSFDLSSWCRGTGVDWPHQIRGMLMKREKIMRNGEME